MKTGLKVNISYSPVSYFFALCTPVIIINEQKHILSWGEHYFDLFPGEYTIRIYAPYLTFRHCGDNSIRISLLEGQQKHIKFRMPLLATSKGDIEEILMQSNQDLAQLESQIKIPDKCPKCYNPNNLQKRICEWCGAQII
jgi:hypothetical protein